MKQNKGTILKSSVDYIRRLKKDRERLKLAENRSQSLEDVNKKLLLRVQVSQLKLWYSCVTLRVYDRSICCCQHNLKYFIHCSPSIWIDFL